MKLFKSKSCQTLPAANQNTKDEEIQTTIFDKVSDPRISFETEYEEIEFFNNDTKNHKRYRFRVHKKSKSEIIQTNKFN